MEPTELARLTTGADYWSTAAGAGLRSLRMADGPHGLRVQDDENPDHLGLGRSAPATCFPPAVTMASSWDPELISTVGAALGREARALGVDIVLGPGVNIKRSPLCGRNFEYYSEDPLLAGVLAGAMVRGIQSEGVAACLKHLAVNNQETERQRISADADERTLHEIYLRAFEIALDVAPAWTVMTAYNRINGVYASENRWLLTDVLRKRWGFDGVVISDWGAVHDPVEAVHSGTDVRMPGRPSDPRVGDALLSGALDVAAVRAVGDRLQLLAQRVGAGPPQQRAAPELDHHELVRKAAAESAVLLTNDGVLPLTHLQGRRVAVIGALAMQPRYQGAGSSAVNPTHGVSAWDALAVRLATAGAEVVYAGGYDVDNAEVDASSEQAAVAAAADCDIVLAFVGLPASAEAEGRDRDSIDLPGNQVSLLRKLGRTDADVVACLSNGAAVTTAAWRDSVSAIVEFWLTGQAHGDTVADVLLGLVPPSGKLTETVPRRLSDTPAFTRFPGEEGHVRYGEGIYVGYRHYDATDCDVEYPFGHGLSYTSFAISDLRVQVNDFDDGVALSATVTVTNTGDRAGAEVVQLYTAEHSERVGLPPKQLRAFQKVFVEPRQSLRVVLEVPRKRLGYYSAATGQWEFEGGEVGILVGTSSRDIAASTAVDVPGRRVHVPLSVWSTYGEWMQDDHAGAAIDAELERRGGIRGRMADLLSDETGRDSVLGVPMLTLAEFPGFPLELADLEQIVSALPSQADPEASDE